MRTLNPGLQNLFIILLSAIVLSGCKGNAGCIEFGAENYDPEAVVNDGSCIGVKDKFLGSFDVTSDCRSGGYTREITATTNDYLVVISNLADTLGSVEAHVSGNNITIHQQQIHTLITIEGAGIYVEDDAISLSYRIRDNRSGVEIIHDCLEWCAKY